MEEEKFIVYPNKGYVDITNFSFNVDGLSAYNYTKYLWDFGDGVRSREKNPTHVFVTPSSFEVTLNAYYGISSYDVYTKNINVDLYLNNSIYFDYVPPPTFAGHLNRYPFKINITSPDLDPHVIDLYANFSRSYSPQDPTNKWTFLRPQWRFIDKNGKQISQIITEDTVIKVDENGKINPNGIVAGVTGTAEFYFVDDIYNFDLAIKGQPHTSIIATLATSATKSFGDPKNLSPNIPSYSNSLAQVILPYIVLWRTPDQLRITENGIREHSNPRWVNSKIPLIINPNFKSLEYPDLLSDGNGVKLWQPDSFFTEYLPFDNTSSIPLSVGFQNLSSYISPQPLEFKYVDDTTYKVAGYYKGTMVVKSTALNETLSAAINFNIPELSGNYFNPLIWIPNQAAGTMNVVQYIKNPHTGKLFFNSNAAKNQNKAIVKSFEVPICFDPDYTTDVMAITGSHGINCIAALPLPCYHAWAIDSDLNKLYRFSSNGNTLCSIDLRTILGNASSKFVSPAFCVLDGEQNLWVTLYDTTSTLKLDSQGKLIFGVSPLTSFYHLTSHNNKYLFDSQFYPITANNGSQIQNFINPTGIDTDLNNNAWVTYSNPFSSYVCKISSNGVTLSTIQYPLYSSPTEILCDNQNNVWIALTNQIYREKSYLEKRNTNGVLLSTFGPFKFINHLTLDNYQNIWFTHSYQYIGSIVNNVVSSYKIPMEGIYANIPDWVDTKNFIFQTSSTNYLLWSNTLSSNYWSKNNVLALENAGIAPNNTPTAEYILEDKNNLSQYFIFNSTGAQISGQQTASVYVKPDTRQYIQLSLSSPNSSNYARTIFYVPSAGSPSLTSLSGTAGIDLSGNWYRCYITGTTTELQNVFTINLHNGVSSNYIGTSSSFAPFLCAVYNNKPSSEFSPLSNTAFSGFDVGLFDPAAASALSAFSLNGLYIWGTQLELGSQPTQQLETLSTIKGQNAITFEVIGNIDETALKGIAFNGNKYLYILNSFENKVVVFNTINKNIEDTFYVNPKGFNFYPDDKNEITIRDITQILQPIVSISPPTKVEYHPWVNSIMATGDWTSWKWSNKYRNISTLNKTISGVSRHLDFYDKNPYEIFKRNEDHDFSEQMRSVTFVESLKNSQFLYNKFLKAIFGKDLHDDLGVLSYEKVANFIKNQADIDECDINALYNLAASVDLDSDDFRLNYPFFIKRLMDIFSINKSILWGDKDKSAYNFSDGGNYGILNRGNKIDINGSIYAGTPVLLKTKSLQKYNLIQTGNINGNSFYDINILADFLKLGEDWGSYYEFYEYIPTTSNEQVEGVIDWDNPNTTLQYYNSSSEFWFGDEKAMETSFAYELYKGLKLLESS
jgi:hypothetical protein